MERQMLLFIVQHIHDSAMLLVTGKAFTNRSNMSHGTKITFQCEQNHVS